MPEEALSDLAIYSAKPTVRIDMQENEMVTEFVIGMEMIESEGGLSCLELRLSNVASDPEGGADLAFNDESILRLGSNIAIYGGDESEPTMIFQGIITALEADFPEKSPPEIVVLAEDVLQQARMTRRTRTHQDFSIADLANDLARQLSLQPQVTGFTDSISTWVQLNESDLAFIRRLLARYDGDMQVVGEELHVSPRNEVRRGTIELELHGQLRKARVLADLAHQQTEMTVTGWDSIQGERISASSEGADTGPGTGRSGKELLSREFTTRHEHLFYPGVLTEREAQHLADAAYDRCARRLVTVSGTAEGNASLRVGTHLTLTGLGSRFDNTYYTTSACHRWDVKRGYETDFEAESAHLQTP